MEPRRLPLWPYLLVLAAAVLPRLPALAGDVDLLWDDRALLVDDPRTASLGSLPGYLSGPYFRDAPGVGLYRPLVNATLTVERVVFGDGAVRLHRGVNLALHALAALLLLALLRRLLPERPVVPILAAALFAEHPACTEVVAWIAARGDSGAAVFSQLALLLHLSRRPLAPLGAAGCLLAAMLFKPVAAVVPAVAVLVDVGLRGLRGRDLLRREPLVRYALLVLPVLVAFALRRGAVGSLVPAGEGVVLRGTDPFHRLVLAGGLLVRHLLALLLPVGLTADYQADPAWREGAWTPPLAYLVSFGAVLAVAGWLLLARRPRAGAATVGIGWAVLFLLPVLQIVPIGALLADRFLYLPAMGLALAGASAIDRLAGGPEGWSTRARIVGAALGLLLSCTFALDLERAAAYRDDGTLNRDVLARFPDGPGEPWRPAGLAEVHVRLGLFLEREAAAAGDAAARRREIARALEQYERAVELDPRGALPHRRLGSLLLDEGRLREAYEALQTALGSRGDERSRALVEYDLARTCIRIEERPDPSAPRWAGDPIVEAIGHLKRALARRPRFPEALYLLGRIDVRYAGKPEEGKELLRQAIALDPRLERYARRWLDATPEEIQRYRAEGDPR